VVEKTLPQIRSKVKAYSRENVSKTLFMLDIYHTNWPTNNPPNVISMFLSKITKLTYNSINDPIPIQHRY